MQKALTSPAVDFVSDLRTIEAPTKAVLAYHADIGDFAQAPTTEGLFDLAYSDRLLKRGLRAP